MTRCRTCNVELTEPDEVREGACRPHGVDNRGTVEELAGLGRWPGDETDAGLQEEVLT